MRDLTKVVFGDGESVVVAMAFAEFATLLDQSTQRGTTLLQVETAGGEPALVNVRRIDYALPAEA